MKKKIIIAALIILTVGIIGYRLYPKHSGNMPVDIIGSDQKIKIQDIKMFLKDFPSQSVNEDPREYFSRDIVNLYTVRFFKFIQTQIEFTSREEHLKAVKAYLHSILDPQKAEEMFALYEKFMDYEIGLHEKAKSWGEPKNAADFLRLLQTVQDYRRDVFGVELADAMWGAEVKAREYTIRKSIITADHDLYGAEKEKRIAALKEDMWGADADLIEDPPETDPEKYASYQEKQAIYQRDLHEMPEARRMQKIKEFREEYFSPDQVARLEAVDEQLADERKKESDYYAQEKAIMINPGIADDKKAEAIRELQDRAFGEEADAFRRRLKIDRNIR
ncbi:MAG: lipase secretion chaperone [Smithella sp.]|jgi:lipase chaperone LimK